MAVIRANRESIDDRSSVLGFTVRSEQPFEIGLATDPDLLRAEHRSRRTPNNFFTSRLLRATPSQRGEAVYLVPPDVVQRFIGQPRLYFGLVTFREGDNSRPLTVRLPDRGSMYVSLAGLTERGLRRTARSRGPGGYGAAPVELNWGADAAPASSGTRAPAPTSVSPSADRAADAPAYSDGYSDELWQQPEPASAAAPATAPSPAAPSASSAPAATRTPAPTDANGNTRPAASEDAPATTAGLRQRAPVSARALLISSDYQPSNLWDALRAQLGFFLDSAMWYLGVNDTRVMPHAATCQIRRPDGSAEGALHGSGFFIAPRLVMTAAHVVNGQSELIVVPGKNGAGTGAANEPFGRFRVTRFRAHPSYADSDFDMALIEVPAANAAPAGRFFDLVEELNQSRPEGVVVSGYAARWYANDLIEHFVNNTIDPNRQHMMGGYIRTLPTDETFSYNIQTLGGTSGSPVYWIEDTGAGPQAHLVGVHVAAHDATTNLGCRITAGKLAWVRQVAAQWGHALSFALGARPEAAAPQPTSRALAPISSDYHPSNLFDALRAQLGFFADSARWFFGVDDTRVMPHAAICQVRLASGGEHGTAFYIAPRLLLTAAHVVDGQSRLTIIPGKNGASGEPFGRFTVTQFERFDGYSGDGDFDRDMALIHVPAANAAPAGRYFDLVEELTQSRPEGAVVSGYAAYSPPDGVVGHLINATIDPNRQHMMGGHIRELPSDGTFTYNIQSLGGTSGSPVYWIEDTGAGPQAHMVGVHVAGHDEHSNRGCRITPTKLNWIRRIAAQWGQSLSFALGARPSREDAPQRLCEPAPTAPRRSPAASAQAIPLDPGVGGQSISHTALAPGDIIVSTARHPVSYAIRAGTVSAVSHAMLYVGDERIIEAVGDGVREVELTTAIGDAILAVAYRDPRVDRESASDIVSYARAHVGRPYNYAGVAMAGYRILHPLRARVIDAIRGATGTDADDARSFYCSELVFAAFREAGLPLVAASPSRSTPADIVDLSQGGLDYVGHLVARDERLGVALALSLGGAPTAARALGGDGPSDHPVHLIPQPNKDACWAAAMAMLLAHRRQQSRTPESIVNEIGASLASSYGWDVLEDVRDRFGFQIIEQPSNMSLYHSPRQWASWLNQFGPLWVVIVGAPHAVVLAGIRGNLDDANAAEVKILNPWDTRVSFDNDPIEFRPANRGYQDWLPFADFAADFGNMAEADYGNWRILHLPQAAAHAQSLSRDNPATGTRLRLARPPAPVRAQSAEPAEPATPAQPSLQPIEPSRVAGTQMQRLVGEAGPSRFRLDQLEGLKAPAAVATPSAAAEALSAEDPAEIRIDLDDWPALEGAPTPLPLRLEFRAEAGAVGNVRIRAGTPAELPYGVEVVARIEDRADPEAGIAALKVRVDYRFRGLTEASPDAFVELCLRGDGQFERENGWVEAAALESAA